MYLNTVFILDASDTGLLGFGGKGGGGEATLRLDDSSVKG